MNKKSLYRIQICAKEKQNRLTMQVGYGMIFVLGGLRVAHVSLSAAPERVQKITPWRSEEMNAV